MTGSRSRARRAFLVLSLSLAALVSMSLTLSSPAVAAAHVATPQVANQTQPFDPGTHAATLRKQFGLRSDAAWIQQVSQTPGASTEQLGILLTPSESANIAGRSARLVPIANAIDKIKSTLAGYAGFWIDQQAGGVPHVLVAGIDPANLVTLKGLAGPGAIIDQVSTSRVDLDALQQKVLDYTQRTKTFKDALVSVGIDEQKNVVAVELAKGTDPSVANGLLATTGNRGISVEYVDGKFTSQSRNRPNIFPLYSGQWTENCTVGASNATVNGSPVMITAGHCFPDPNGLFYQGKTGANNSRPTGDLIGSTIVNTFRDGTNCDCQAAGVLNSRLPTSSVILNDTQTFKYNSTANAGNYAVGQKLCMSGANYADQYGGGIACGTVANSSASIRYSDAAYLVNDVVITNIGGSSGGDSGAPYGNGGAFLGIHAAGYGLQGAPSAQTALSKATNFPTLDPSTRLVY